MNIHTDCFLRKTPYIGYDADEIMHPYLKVGNLRLFFFEKPVFDRFCEAVAELKAEADEKYKWED